MEYLLCVRHTSRVYIGEHNKYSCPHEAYNQWEKKDINDRQHKQVDFIASQMLINVIAERKGESGV